MKRKRKVLLALLGFVTIGVAGVVADGWTAFGASATGARRERMERSPQWQDGHFENPQVIVNDNLRALTSFVDASPDVSPREPIAVAASVDAKLLATAPASGLRITWFGHSATLVEIDGVRILTDPNWSERASPLTWIGPTRYFAPPIALEALPPIDAVVISHDHYDHLDHATMVALTDRAKAFIVPLGVGAHLAYWGVPESRIVELDWWERTKVAELEIVATPARHQSGRFLKMAGTLWASYAFIGAQHRVYFSGDTGLFPALQEIGDELGPFDVTMIEVGQYHSTWPDWHIGPEQAVVAHGLLRGRVFFPVHWGLLPLAMHGWTEPIERVLVAAERAGVAVVAPKPGESVEPSAPPALQRWWPPLAWQTAAQAPIVSGHGLPEPSATR